MQLELLLPLTAALSSFNPVCMFFVHFRDAMISLKAHTLGKQQCEPVSLTNCAIVWPFQSHKCFLVILLIVNVFTQSFSNVLLSVSPPHVRHKLSPVVLAGCTRKRPLSCSPATGGVLHCSGSATGSTCGYQQPAAEGSDTSCPSSPQCGASAGQH